MKKARIGLIACITFLAFTFSVKAGSLSISASRTAVTTGNSVIITVKALDMAGQFSITSSNGGVLSGGTNSTWIDNGSQTFTFQANSNGSATVTVKTIDVADYSGNPVSTSKSVTINVSEPKPIILSDNNNLTSLSIDGATLSPEFSSDTLEYSVELEPDTSKININATAASGANISGIGEREVTDGDNRIEIIVTAENGTTKTYIINAIVKEYNPIEVSVNDEKYSVVRKKSLLTMPNNYEETTVKINGEEIPAFKGIVTKYILVGLKDEKGNINLYIYDAKKKSYTPYKEYTFNRIILYPIELSKNKIPAGYKKYTIKYNDEIIVAYKLNKNSKYAIINGMNIETGKINLYMYDSTEDTLQLYNSEEVNSLKEKNKQYLIILIVVLVVVLILVISLFITLTKLLHYKNNQKFIDIRKEKKDLKNDINSKGEKL